MSTDNNSKAQVTTTARPGGAVAIVRPNGEGTDAIDKSMQTALDLAQKSGHHHGRQA